MKPMDSLEMFQVQFCEVVNVIEEASRYGTSPQSEERYVKLRAWLMLHYKSVRHVLAPLLPVEDAGNERMMWHGKKLDAFEKLMACSTLERAVRQPESVLTKRLQGVKGALESLSHDPVAV